MKGWREMKKFIAMVAFTLGVVGGFYGHWAIRQEVAYRDQHLRWEKREMSRANGRLEEATAYFLTIEKSGDRQEAENAFCRLFEDAAEAGAARARARASGAAYLSDEYDE